MKKIYLLFTATGLLLSNVSFSQSNTPGVIQLGLGWGMTLGGAAITNSLGSNKTNETGLGANVNEGLRVQYGLADRFSAGIYIRKEGAAYITTDAISSSSSTFITSGLGVGVEGKFYAVNKDKFALYVGPTIGFSSASTTSTPSNSSYVLTGKASGLNYSVCAGFNWWWAQFIGMSLDLGYNASSIAGTEPITGTSTSIATTIHNGGIYFGLGLVGKFGGSGGGGHHGRK